MNSKSKQPENGIFQKDKTVANLHMKQYINKNIYDLFNEKGDSNFKDNKIKRKYNLPKSNINKKLSLEKGNNNELFNINIYKNNKPQKTYINTGNDETSSKIDSTQGNIQSEVNICTLIINSKIIIFI